jgi:hypothetical protein
MSDALPHPLLPTSTSMTHPLFFPVLLSFIVSWMHVWLWLYSLGPYSPTNPTGILAMTFWFIFIWTWFELANLDRGSH